MPFGELELLRRMRAAVGINPAGRVVAVAGAERDDAIGGHQEFLRADGGEESRREAEGAGAPDASFGRGLQVLDEVFLVLGREQLRQVAGRGLPAEAGAAFPTTAPVRNRILRMLGTAAGGLQPCLVVIPGVRVGMRARQVDCTSLTGAFRAVLPCVR